MQLKPVIPFEPINTDPLPDGPQWVAQVKWDGVRVLTYYDGDEVRLFNRKLNERTVHYPELVKVSEYCSARSVILDGEIIALKDGKPSFYKVMKRDGITKLSNVITVMKNIPITYMIFDVLYFNDQWVISHSLAERQKILSEIIKPKDYVQLVENFDDAKALYEVIKAQEMEGLVVKDLSSSYLINGKDQRWRKKKFYKDLIAVVGGVTLRDTIVNSLLLGLFDHDGRLWYIGHAGTGRLTQKDWYELTKSIKPLIESTMPFVNKPPRSKQTIWLKPEITVKVNFTEWIDGHTLRQPSIQAFVDIPPQECLLP
ncbi:RNA ligase family protein [Paenactinomyces guangxiensis]|uniref:DNA ligase (ATP) n=1 Tax=Paenactinomyces guangxiensis TaxID=1490290 RepID=A0A7W2A824_9BACL|nr:RNA ligase family protein [Paenactinomyces guangxiensis]MBA4495151.1 DNA ligase [Paenactinomyces guangxiensis]MBH8592165.1 DNA ligase [Paenactinomyces guangxiensis]